MSVVSSGLIERIVNNRIAGENLRGEYKKASLKLIYFINYAHLKEVGVKIYEIGDNQIASLVRVTYSCMMPTSFETKKKSVKRTITPGYFLPNLLRSFVPSDHFNSPFIDQLCRDFLEEPKFEIEYNRFKQYMDNAVKSYLQDPDQIEIIQSKIRKFKGRIRDRQSNELKALYRKLYQSAWDKEEVLNLWREIQCEEIMES